MYSADVANPVIVDWQKQLLDSPDFGSAVGSWYSYADTSPVSLEMVTSPIYSYHAPNVNGYAAKITVASASGAPVLAQRGFSVTSGQTYVVQLAVRRGSVEPTSYRVSVVLKTYNYSTTISDTLLYRDVLTVAGEWYLLRGMVQATTTTTGSFIVQFPPVSAPGGTYYIDDCMLSPAIDLRAREYAVKVSMRYVHQRTRGGTLYSYRPTPYKNIVFEVSAEMISSAEQVYLSSLWMTPHYAVGLLESVTSWRESELPTCAASLYRYCRIISDVQPCPDFAVPHGDALRFGTIILESTG